MTQGDAFEREFKGKDETGKGQRGQGSRAAEVGPASRRSRSKRRTAFHHFVRRQTLLNQPNRQTEKIGSNM